MSTRIRGEHNTDWGRWRPRARHGGATATAGSLASPNQPTRLAVTGWERGRARRRLVIGGLGILAAVAIIAASVATSGVLSSAPAADSLPATPRAWLDAYEAAAIDNPSRMCSRLFAPQLAVAYGTAVHGSCTAYFRRITSFSLVVRRVLEDGGTAVVELRQTVRPQAWAVVLSHRPAGWQAVDLLPGDLVR